MKLLQSELYAIVIFLSVGPSVIVSSHIVWS